MSGYGRMARLDFSLMKSQRASYWSLAGMLLMFAVMGSSVVLLGINGAWFMALMSINIFAVQEKNNLDQLYGSVSLRWRDIIGGRYISLSLSYMASFVLVVLVHLAFSWARHNTGLLSDILLSFSLSFLAFSMIISVEVPLMFKLGYTKARAWALLPYLLVMALFFAPYYVYILFGKDNAPSLAAVLSVITGHMNRLASYRAALIVGGILAGVAIQYLSYHAAVAIYRRRR